MQRQRHAPWWEQLRQRLELPADLEIIPVSGGSIADTWRLRAADFNGFLKTMPAGETLVAEADGLEALAATETVPVPRVLDRGEHLERSWLLLEWLPLTAPDGAAWRRLGEALAAMHGQPRGSFGWHRDNFIGATAQPNGESRDWAGFFRERRLRHQMRLARGNGLDGNSLDILERLLEVLHVFLPASVVPSLLHGDLWSGNIAASGARPVIFDPAVYCGHSEADLAMMELFGAPPTGFWSAYGAHRPLQPGYRARRDLYNLYHLLNHFNLFGGGYGGQAVQVARRLLAEAGS